MTLSTPQPIEEDLVRLHLRTNPLNTQILGGIHLRGSRMSIESPQRKDLDEILHVAKSTQVFDAEELGIIQEMFDGFFHPSSYYDHSFIVYRHEETGAIGGFAVYGPVTMTDRVWDLYWICVNRAEQGNGVGLALLQRMEQDLCARGARAIYLETSTSELYHPARNFYERHGFEVAACLPDYYAPGEGMCIYRKTFPALNP